VIDLASKQENGDPKASVKKAIREINRAQGPSCFFSEDPIIASTYVEQVGSTNSGGFTYLIHKVRIVGVLHDEPCITQGDAEPSCKVQLSANPFTHPKDQFVFTSPLHNFAGGQTT
jgi:hypothetical protein